MSLVFLADEFVYKVKKPVNLGYLDYSSLSARRSFCEKEVELNRRLCASAYLGVVRIVRADDKLVVEGDGEAIEFAVKMRRLPADRMLDQLILKDAATAGTMRKIARRVADFHMSSHTTEEISSFGQRGVIRGNTDENFEQTGPYIGRTITKSTHSLVKDYTDEFLDTRAGLFDARIEEGRILDCHGDLHAAHVCMTDEVCIYDCIEFNDRFRYGDVSSEVGFLAMDLDRYSRRDLSEAFVDAYVEQTGDDGLIALLDFYKCYRAFVRGKVEGFRASDKMASADEQSAAVWRARRYFQLARGYATGKGSLVIMSGLSGSGKSRVARELADRLGCTIVASDVIRKQLAGLSPEEKRHVPFGEGLYSEDWTVRTYDEMIRRGATEIEQGKPVILDASFLQRWERRKAIEMAQRSGVRPVVAECVAPYDTLMKRLAGRDSISDARPEILDRQRETQEPIREHKDAEHLVLDTCNPVDETVEELWKHL
ncbi:MAG: AAA family ATPase [Chloroflexota bacterium]